MTNSSPADEIITCLPLTRAQRREMKKLVNRVDRVAQADRAFFERRPDRQHRVRLASQAELAYQTLIGVRPLTAPLGCQVFVAVRNVVSGARLRILVFGLEGSETDLSEAEAQAVFEMAAPPQTGEIEEQTRAIVGTKP